MTIDDGVGKPHPTDKISLHFPCSLLKAISVQESVGWHRFCVPTGPDCPAVSRTLIAFDCGYGLMQVTSGMTVGATSAYDADRVAGEAAYNVAVGSQILAEKWAATPSVGDNRVDAIEDWYFSVWAYNVLAFNNNASNPAYAADRPPYRDPGGLSGGEYPCQELIWGYVRHPVLAPDGSEAYKSWPLSYPLRAEICASCGGPSASISDPSPLHWSDCPSAIVAPPDVGVVDAAARDAPIVTTDATTDATTNEAIATADGADDASLEVASDAAGDAGDGADRRAAISGDFHGSVSCSAGPRARASAGASFAVSIALSLFTRRRRRSPASA